LVDVFGKCDAPLRIFWAQDDYQGGAALMHLSPRRVARGEQSRARDADVIVTSSPSVQASWQRAGFRPVLIPFGCDADAYVDVGELPRPDDVDLPSPIALLVGHINDRTDVRLLEAVAQRDVSLLLVGPVDPRFRDELDALCRRPRVQWVGPKPAPELGGYLQVADVGLVPYADSAFNRGSFPLKILEYLAAGLPVVATDLPSVRWFDSESISVAGTVEAFADDVVRWCRTPRDRGAVDARRAFAHGHTWRVRADAWVSLIAAQVSRR